MANLDTENKRRSATGIFHVYTIPPKPDGTIDADDREHATYLYAGLGAGASPAGYYKPVGLLMGVYRMKWVS